MRGLVEANPYHRPDNGQFTTRHERGSARSKPLTVSPDALITDYMDTMLSRTRADFGLANAGKRLFATVKVADIENLPVSGRGWNTELGKSIRYGEIDNKAHFKYDPRGKNALTDSLGEVSFQGWAKKAGFDAQKMAQVKGKHEPFDFVLKKDGKDVALVELKTAWAGSSKGDWRYSFGGEMKDYMSKHKGVDKSEAWKLIKERVMKRKVQRAKAVGLPVVNVYQWWNNKTGQFDLFANKGLKFLTGYGSMGKATGGPDALAGLLKPGARAKDVYLGSLRSPGAAVVHQ